MIIHVKQACEFMNKDGEKYWCANNFIGTPPEWVKDNAFFQRMCTAGLITAHIDSKAVDEQMKADEKAEKGKKK